MRESMRMVIVLTVIAMVSAGVLSQVYNVTSVIIAENRAREMESTVYELFADAASVEFIEADFVMFRAKDGDGTTVGFAYASEAGGYAGPVRVMVGVGSDTMEIVNVAVLQHTETPGLGSQIEDEGFRSQFQGKSADSPITIGQDIDNITGATVSAEAVARAVRRNFSDAIAAFEGGQ